jgi:hypothetical protein
VVEKVNVPPGCLVMMDVGLVEAPKRLRLSQKTHPRSVELRVDRLTVEYALIMRVSVELTAGASDGGTQPDCTSEKSA